MKEDYLWDKTGEDLEIGKLENQLEAFRSNNTTPPRLPGKKLVVDKDSIRTESPFSFFRLAFASSAVLGLLLISIGIFLTFQSDTSPSIVNDTEGSPIVEKTVEAETGLVNEENPLEKPPIEVSPKEQEITKTVFISKENTKKRVYRASRRAKKKAKTRKATARQPRVRKPNADPNGDTVLLTKEEIYAYEQLMKALTITSTKLKIVRDKVNGAE